MRRHPFGSRDSAPSSPSPWACSRRWRPTWSAPRRAARRDRAGDHRRHGVAGATTRVPSARARASVGPPSGSRGRPRRGPVDERPRPCPGTTAAYAHRGADTPQVGVVPGGSKYLGSRSWPGSRRSRTTVDGGGWSFPTRGRGARHGSDSPGSPETTRVRVEVDLSRRTVTVRKLDQVLFRAPGATDRRLPRRRWASTSSRIRWRSPPRQLLGSFSGRDQRDPAVAPRGMVGRQPARDPWDEQPLVDRSER